MFGASADPYLGSGDWLFGIAARGLRSHDHYSGTVEQVQRQEQKNYVVNEQYLLDLSGTYAVTRRFSLSGALPLVRASWSIPLPVRPVPGERSEQNAQGIGDISVTGRYWMFNPDVHQRGNLSLGLGIKAPTGDSNVEDSYPDLTGANEAAKSVDQSIQPGDGGWGGMFEIQGFKRIARSTFYGAGSYLANPRDTNDTPSIIVGLGVPVTPAVADRLVNSVPDQYLLRAGAAFALGQSAFSGGLGLRIEGVPRYDLFGASHGFRRPGYEVFAEPSFTWSHGNDAWWLAVPIGIKRNRRPDPYTGAAGDATFPNYIFLAGLTHRFGARSTPAGGAPPQAGVAPGGETSPEASEGASCAAPGFDSSPGAP